MKSAFYGIVGGIALLLASLPYLFGAINVPPGHVYTGLTYNIDDVAVYLSWIRQVEDGAFFQRNLFATEPQKGAMFSFFSLLLGGIARVTHLSPVAVYHLARIVFGALLLWSVLRLLRETLSDERTRRTAFVLVCFSAGLGWTTGGYDPAKAFAQPIDLWQPEAIVFLSLYYAPLFTAALALMVVFLTAVLRAERSGRLAHIWPAALAGFLLGNFHTYDVVHLFAVWFVYRILTDLAAKKIDKGGWLRFLLVGAAAFVTTAYQYYALLQDPIFRSRDIATKSEAIWWTLLGFGLLVPLAVAALFRKDTETFSDSAAKRLLGTWAIVGLLIAYAPVDFQRKLLMGTQIPYCLLAGAALVALTSRLSGDFPKIALAFGVLLTVPSNALFLLRDTERLSANVGSTSHRPYLTVGEKEGLDWLRQNTKPGDTILVSPDPLSHKRFPFFALEPYLSVYIPAFTGRTVYNGHWSETPDYRRKVSASRDFFYSRTDDTARVQLLRDNNIRYVLRANALDTPPTDAQGNPLPYRDGPYTAAPWTTDGPPPYLKPVCQTAEITIYSVELP